MVNNFQPSESNLPILISSILYSEGNQFVNEKTKKEMEKEDPSLEVAEAIIKENIDDKESTS